MASTDAHAEFSAGFVSGWGWGVGGIFAEPSLELEKASFEPLVTDHGDEDREPDAGCGLHEHCQKVRADPASHRVLGLIVVEGVSDDSLEDVDAVAVFAKEAHPGTIEEATDPVPWFSVDADDQQSAEEQSDERLPDRMEKGREHVRRDAP